MWWLLVIAPIVIGLSFLEWRSWKKPLPSRLKQDWRVNNGKDTGRLLTGGHTFGQARRVRIHGRLIRLLAA
jgi:hypothetical protein